MFSAAPRAEARTTRYPDARPRASVPEPLPWTGDCRPHSLWPDGRHRAFIPWELEPVVAGHARHSTQGCAAITLKTGHPVYLPMFPIPLGYVQLQRAVEFYSTRPELRGELAAEAGLERVRALMRAPA